MNNELKALAEAASIKRLTYLLSIPMNKWGSQDAAFVSSMHRAMMKENAIIEEDALEDLSSDDLLKLLEKDDLQES